MSKRYSGKSFKDRSVMKKPKLTFKEKRKLKKEKNERRKSPPTLENHTGSWRLFNVLAVHLGSP